MTMINKSPLVIIGMHRSGTTLLTQILERSGVLMGRDMIAYGESNFFQRCNMDLLTREHADWDKPIATDAMPRLYSTQHHLTEYARVMKHPIGWWPLLQAKGWGWKDPRNTFTLGSWLNVFPNLHAIHIYRNGMEVARSLYERNAMLQPESKWHSPKLTDLNTCFDLWEAYVQQAQSWKVTLGKRYLAVRYEDLVDVKENTISELEDFTGRMLKAATHYLVKKEPRIKDPLVEMDALCQKAKTNQTLLRLGYVV